MSRTPPTLRLPSPLRPWRPFVLVVASSLLAWSCAGVPGARSRPPLDEAAMAQQVEIRRTEYGVPHILAPDLRAAAFGLAYVQLEDHGTSARTRWALAPGKHDERPRDPAAQPAPRVDRRLLRGARPCAGQAGLLRRLPDRRPVHGDRRVQPAPRLRDDQQRHALTRVLRAASWTRHCRTTSSRRRVRPLRRTPSRRRVPQRRRHGAARRASSGPRRSAHWCIATTASSTSTAPATGSSAPASSGSR
jgi:hypothetical protein